MKKYFLLVLLFTASGILAHAQRKILDLPDVPGYVTLKCDLHMHTVFSDGDVWPTVRVDEAVRDGLDAIAITDHLEYNPKKDILPVDHNAAWKICQDYAREQNLILVHGTEITRKMPPGHFCALFIKDASLLTKDEVMDDFEEAIRQGAFIQWNHPGWKAQETDGIPKMYDVHRKLIEKGWLHGIEFYNDAEFYPLVFTFSQQNNLTLTGNSDVHAIISERYGKPEHRPMTLALAKERSHDSLKEALFAGRTIVYFGNTIAGKEEWLRPFFNQCISTGKPYYNDSKNVWFEVTNKSEIPFELVNGPADAPVTISLPANTITRVSVSKKVKGPLTYDVKNAITGENAVLRVELKYQ